MSIAKTFQCKMCGNCCRNMRGRTGEKDMLTEAWYLLYHPNAMLFNTSTQMFADLSTWNISLPYPTSKALALQFLLGISPINTTIAFPLEELYYEYVYDIDPDLFRMDYNNSKIRVSIYKEGALRFIYGGVPVDYNFPSSGVWEVTFNSTWTGITGVDKIGDLPLDRKYFYPVLV